MNERDDEIDPDDMRSIVEENERMRKAFDEALQKLTAGQPIHSGVCTWCGQHWPHLDGESYETFRTYTREHAEVCPANDLRIERDRLRAQLEEIQHDLARVTTEHMLAVCDYDQVKKQAGSLQSMIGTDRDCHKLRSRLHARSFAVEAMWPVAAAAGRIRDLRCSAKSGMDADDRREFDALNTVVDEYRKLKEGM